jgi:nitroimidazol reductase NimA-like FMN-containing flavoprotein (pyridoxamine 5'-phosphate oxidase superfamily)
MAVQWPLEVDEILRGDQVVALGSATPAHGSVISPMTNFAVHDRAQHLVRVNSSIGAAKKLERLRANPNVALAFHSRDYSESTRLDFVLVQGTAKVLAPVEDFPGTLGERWEEKEGPRPRGWWDWWLRSYHTRVPVDVAVQRVIVWPDLAAARVPQVYGPPLPPPAQAQKPPAGGTEPRVDAARVATRAENLPNVLLGWVGADGFPMIVPVAITGGAPDGVRLTTAAPILPAGGRRAGLTAHEFSRHQHGEQQRIHTGWLDVGPDCRTAVYRPHSTFGFRMPPSKTLYQLIIGLAARRGARPVTPAT